MCHIASGRRERLEADAARRLFLSSSSSRLPVVASRPLLLSRSPYRNRACLVATLSRLNTSFHSRNPPSAGGERARAHNRAVTSYPPRGCAGIKEFSHSFFLEWGVLLVFGEWGQTCLSVFQTSSVHCSRLLVLPSLPAAPNRH